MNRQRRYVAALALMAATTALLVALGSPPGERILHMKSPPLPQQTR